MSFYPAATHAYNAGYDDGFFGNDRRAGYRSKNEQDSYDLGYRDGVKHRPKPKVEKPKKVEKSK